MAHKIPTKPGFYWALDKYRPHLNWTVVAVVKSTRTATGLSVYQLDRISRFDEGSFIWGPEVVKPAELLE